MFSGAQNLAVTGQTLINVTNYYISPSTVPSDVKMVPLWDIDLQHEISFDNGAGLVNRHRIQPSVRRMYSARIGGQSTTVAIYQGHDAEEEWRRDLAKYISIRQVSYCGGFALPLNYACSHPNIIQLRGATSSGSIRAMLFHDDLIPLEHFVNLHRHSYFHTVYIYAYCSMELKAVKKYFAHDIEDSLNERDCTLWIRRSTGRLCVDLAEPNTVTYLYWSETSAQEPSAWTAPNPESILIQSLTLKEYHQICVFHLRRHRQITVSTSIIPVNLGTVISWSSSNRFEDSVGIAFLPNIEVYPGQWVNTGAAQGERIKEGWTRFIANNVFDCTLKLVCLLSYIHWESWLSQANHVFSRLHNTSSLEDCALSNYISFEAKIPPTTEELPAGFLFLCPGREFQIGPSLFSWPELPAYWSLDSLGAERLSVEEATALGFPSLEMNTEILGSSWDTGVYAGTHQFYQAKGFDPESQDVARHLGHPLYQLFSELDPPFAHVDEEEEFYSGEGDEDEMDLSW
ncbi:hypothetical protein B0H19DRAFT_1374022 [Mycena capillaripes]|nr:hypothetical protein B0H19DRAFT_1374022 [Mycena capillaripes]